jgi:hypothetical protein
MSTATALVGMQMNEAKSKVRSMITAQIENFTTQTKSHASVISLPSTEWLFEKQLMSSKTLIRKIIGTELKPDILKISKQKMPNCTFVKLLPYDIDSLIKFDTDCNVFWADYCGAPGIAPEKKGGHASFPHLDTFVEKVVNTSTPFVYYMTFCCVPRSSVKGAGQKLFKAMAQYSVNCSFQDAIEKKIFRMLKQEGKESNVKRIMKIHYIGGGSGHSDMVTLGFAVNFAPSFTTYEHDWTKKNEGENLQAKAISVLKSLKWDSTDIAKALSISPSKVGAIFRFNGGAGYRKNAEQTQETQETQEA